MQYGDNVLDRVSKLLVQMDNSRSPIKKTPKLNRTDYEKGFSYRHHQNYQKDNQNKLITQQYQRNKKKVYNDIQHVHSFKVSNKHSIFLNNQKQQKPIYQRTEDIMYNRSVTLEKKRAEYEREKMRKKEQQELQEEEKREEVYQMQTRKASKKQLERILKRLTNDQKSRLEKHHREKMDFLKHKITGRPSITKESSQYFEKRKLEKSLSQNVFERFDQYLWERKKSHAQKVQKVIEMETPFKPKISKNSEELARKTKKSRPKLTEDLSREMACRCLGKGQKSTRVNTSKIQKSPSRSDLSVSPLNKGNKLKSKVNLSLNPDFY